MIGNITDTINYIINYEIHPNLLMIFNRYISWSYGLCWSSAVFGVGSAVLLFSKHEHSQVYYKEKTFTNGVRTA